MGCSTMTPLCRKIVAMPLITFEASEGCGKSTRMKLLAARLKKWGIRPAVLREPGGTAIGEPIRHLLQHSEDNHAMTRETELLRFEASRSQLVREKIQPALRRAYRELAENEPRRVVQVDGRKSVHLIEDEIWQTISGRFLDLGKDQTSIIKLQTS